MLEQLTIQSYRLAIPSSHIDWLGHIPYGPAELDTLKRCTVCILWRITFLPYGPADIDTLKHCTLFALWLNINLFVYFYVCFNLL